MRKAIPLRLVALLIMMLVVSIPVVLADQLNLVHDKRGNLVSGDGFFREYNEFNQLVRIRNGTSISSQILEDYTYHPTQERVLIKHVYNNSGGLKETVYYISEEFVRVKNTSGTYDTTYVHVDGQLVAQKNSDGTKNFIHADHLGSASVVTDSLGNAIENTSYEPFGGIVSGGSKSRFSYTGQEYDSAIQDYDFNARRYKASWGMFIQPDNLLPEVSDPQQLNRYAYSQTNPYRYIDVSGKASIEKHFAYTFISYSAATLDPILSFQIAANAAEPDLIKGVEIGGLVGIFSQKVATRIGLDLQMGIKGQDAHYYYHFGQGSGGLSSVDLQSTFDKAVQAGNLDTAGNIEHGLGLDVGSNGIPGYHEKEIEQGHDAYVSSEHSIHDLFGVGVRDTDLIKAQYERAKSLRPYSRTYRAAEKVRATVQTAWAKIKEKASNLRQRITGNSGQNKDTK